MARDDLQLLQGTLDVLVLKTLSWGPRHGYAIARWIKDTTDAALQVEDRALYIALHRMEEREWIEAEWGVTENNRQARVLPADARGAPATRGEKRHLVALRSGGVQDPSNHLKPRHSHGTYSGDPTIVPFALFRGGGQSRRGARNRFPCGATDARTHRARRRTRGRQGHRVGGVWRCSGSQGGTRADRQATPAPRAAGRLVERSRSGPAIRRALAGARASVLDCRHRDPGAWHRRQCGRLRRGQVGVARCVAVHRR